MLIFSFSRISSTQAGRGVLIFMDFVYSGEKYIHILKNGPQSLKWLEYDFPNDNTSVKDKARLQNCYFTVICDKQVLKLKSDSPQKILKKSEVKILDQDENGNKWKNWENYWSRTSVIKVYWRQIGQIERGKLPFDDLSHLLFESKVDGKIEFLFSISSIFFVCPF